MISNKNKIKSIISKEPLQKNINKSKIMSKIISNLNIKMKKISNKPNINSISPKYKPTSTTNSVPSSVPFPL